MGVVTSGVVGISVATAIANATESWISILAILPKIAAIMGLFFFFASIMKFIEHANGKAQLRTPLFMFLVAVGLFSYLQVADTFTNTLSMGSKVSNPGDVLMSAGSSCSGSVSCSTRDVIKGCLIFIQMIGGIAVIRGWLLLNQYAQQAREGLIGRALTHLFGGVAALNMKVTLAVLGNTFGWTATFSTFGLL